MASPHGFSRQFFISKTASSEYPPLAPTSTLLTSIHPMRAIVEVVKTNFTSEIGKGQSRYTELRRKQMSGGFELRIRAFKSGKGQKRGD
jgi:hypothetical protein